MGSRQKSIALRYGYFGPGALWEVNISRIAATMHFANEGADELVTD